MGRARTAQLQGKKLAFFFSFSDDCYPSGKRTPSQPVALPLAPPDRARTDRPRPLFPRPSSRSEWMYSAFTDAGARTPRAGVGGKDELPTSLHHKRRCPFFCLHLSLPTHPLFSFPSPFYSLANSFSRETSHLCYLSPSEEGRHHGEQGRHGAVRPARHRDSQRLRHEKLQPAARKGHLATLAGYV